jgi:Na+/H+ antiporter NhaD/arsenite permease-like protein
MDRIICMRTVLVVLNCSTLILVAGLPAGNGRWWVALLGAVAVLLLGALTKQERRQEQREEREAMALQVRSTLYHDQPVQTDNDDSR